MSTEYSSIKSGKLKLKGDGSEAIRKAKKKAKKEKKARKRKHTEVDNDESLHSGWYKYFSVEEMKPGLTAVEFGDKTYVFSMDTGLFTLGAPRKETGGAPEPEEQYFLSKISNTKIALKSGYGKYLGVDKAGIVNGRSEAITPLEQFEPVWQEVDGIQKCAIIASNGCFIEFNEEGDLIANKRTAEESHYLCIRTNIPKVEINPIPLEERGNAADVELKMAKKFQHWQDMKMKISKESINDVKRAKKNGTLHTVLLDRRAGMKSDKYCK